MTKDTLPIDGVEVPGFFYGTAWKEEQTQHLTELAIVCGFRGIDTANQRRHYDEAAVGQAISGAISSAEGLSSHSAANKKWYCRCKSCNCSRSNHRSVACSNDNTVPTAIDGTEQLASWRLVVELAGLVHAPFSTREVG